MKKNVTYCDYKGCGAACIEHDAFLNFKIGRSDDGSGKMTDDFETIDLCPSHMKKLATHLILSVDQTDDDFERNIRLIAKVKKGEL